VPSVVVDNEGGALPVAAVAGIIVGRVAAKPVAIFINLRWRRQQLA
jgi:hypothetical protein